jgi:hypothetical protein
MSLKAVIGWCGGAAAACTTAVTLYNYGGNIYDFQHKLGQLDKISTLEDRIKQLEARVSANGVAGPEGPRGFDGKPGRTGDAGPSGPKGEPGVTLAQLADFERRLASLEKRPTQVTRRPAEQGTPAELASADPAAVPVTPKAGFLTHATGCKFLPPNFVPFSSQIKVGDRFCNVSGDMAVSVSKITDDRVHMNGPNCGLGEICNAYFSNKVAWKVKKIDMATTGDMVAAIDWMPR